VQALFRRVDISCRRGYGCGLRAWRGKRHLRLKSVGAASSSGRDSRACSTRAGRGSSCWSHRRGYGKTTLAHEWLEGKRATWYRASPASADVAALAAGLARAAAEIVPGAGARMTQRLRATDRPDEDARILAEMLADDLAEWPDAWLAIDDYQFAMDSPASEEFRGPSRRRLSCTVGQASGSHQAGRNWVALTERARNPGSCAARTDERRDRSDAVREREHCEGSYASHFRETRSPHPHRSSPAYRQLGDAYAASAAEAACWVAPLDSSTLKSKRCPDRYSSLAPARIASNAATTVVSNWLSTACAKRNRAT
jgi:hypothetical protein